MTFSNATLRECGARLDADLVFVGDEPVRWSTAGEASLGRDGYRIERRERAAHITADSAVARHAAMLDLADMQANGQHRLMRKLRFDTRNYKHELNLMPAAGHDRALIHYTESFWSNVCRELVRRHFNGIVFYAMDGGFDRLLDFDQFSDAVETSASLRTRNREQFNMLLRVARRYGLRTFLQQYLTSYPAKLADKLKLPVRQRKHGRAPREVMAYLDHPVINDYSRYCYRRLFELCPDLDGLYLNSESAPNGFDFVDSVVLPTLNKLPVKPTLLFRLWYATNPTRLGETIRKYDGSCMLGHKIMDTMDTYNWPAADTHILEWKDALAKQKLDVPFNYLVGPCHNCGSGISRTMWSDPQFVHTTLSKAEKLGADGVSFHTVFELTSDEFDASASKNILSDHEREMARLNHFHLETAVDFFRGDRFDEKRAVEKHAKHFQLSRGDAGRAYRSLRDISRAITLPFLQFPLTTQEGYSYDARRSFVQQPLFIPHAGTHNNDHKRDMHQFWSWLNRTRASSAYPNDLQEPIDFVDPARRKTKRNPRVMSSLILSLAEHAHRESQPIRRKLGPTFAGFIDEHRHLARCVHHDIESGLALFRLYFTTARRHALTAVKETLKHLQALDKLVTREGSPYLHMKQDYAPAQDVDAVTRLERHLRQNYPFDAFRAFAASKARYNEIRRHVRPWRVYSDATLHKAKQLLKQSHRLAVEAARLAQNTPHELHANHWMHRLEQELHWIDLPVMACGDTPAPFQPLADDNCFNYGNFAYNDFLAFFEPMVYGKPTEQSLSVHRDDKHVIVTAREDRCDMKERLAQWKRFAGNMDLSGCIRLFISTQREPHRLQNYCFFPRGEAAIHRELHFHGRQDIRVPIPRLLHDYRAAFRHDRTSWSLTIHLPYYVLGDTPQSGDTWRFNFASNIRILRNHQASWCAGYETGPGNPSRMGVLRFE